MKPIQYSEILKRSLLMTWKNKSMWFFGLLIFLGTIASNININASSMSEKSGQFQAIKIFIQNHLAVSILAGLILIAFLITFFLLKFIAIAGIIKMANNIAVYRQSKIKPIFCEVKKYLWPLLLLEIMINIALFATIIILFIPVACLFALKANFFAVSSFIIAFLIAVSLAIIAYYLRRYAYFYIILGNMKIRTALETAYHLLRKNIRESLVMGCVAVALGIAALAVFFLLIIIAAVIISPFGLMAYLIFAKAGAIAVLIIGVIIEVVILVSLFSGYASFSQVVWVLFFQEISLEKQEKKITVDEAEAETKIPNPEVV